ncbi:MAG: hypothetical protein M1571_10525 [Firmicutes bacterium]|nr:hypothetical protein [Bacillota bacterium]
MGFFDTLNVNYLGGHPNLVKQNVIGSLHFEEDELVFRSTGLIGAGKKLFGIPYKKIISVTTDMEKDWSGMRLAAGWLFLGPIGAMLFGKKKTSHLGILVQGKDDEDNPVEVPIAFSLVYGSMITNEEAKTKLLQRISKIKKITI